MIRLSLVLLILAGGAQAAQPLEAMDVFELEYATAAQISPNGELTAWMIGNTNRFRAAVAFYPVINWESFIFTADLSELFLNYWVPGLPWRHRDNFEARSLLKVSENVTTPTLIMTGEEDWRTPMSESEQYYKSLKLQGVETVLVRVPEEPHGIVARPSHAMSKMTTLLGWFRKHSLQPEG